MQLSDINDKPKYYKSFEQAQLTILSSDDRLPTSFLLLYTTL